MSCALPPPHCPCKASWKCQPSGRIDLSTISSDHTGRGRSHGHDRHLGTPGGTLRRRRRAGGHPRRVRRGVRSVGGGHSGFLPRPGRGRTPRHRARPALGCSAATFAQRCMAGRYRRGERLLQRGRWDPFRQSLLGLRKVIAPRMPDSARFCLLPYDVRCKDVPKTPYGYGPRVSTAVSKVLLDSPIALNWAFDCRCRGYREPPDYINRLQLLLPRRVRVLDATQRWT